MRFLVDGQLPPALAAQLRTLGHDAIHVYELGLGGASDAAIWSRATKEDRVVVSKDEDFAAMAMRPDAQTGVLWVRLGITTNRVLWAALRPILPEVVSAFAAGEKLVEVR